MSIQNFLNKLKEIYEKILDLIDNDEDSEANFLILQKLFDKINIQNDKHNLKLLLHLILNIGNNYRRGSNFFGKIEHILHFYKNIIIKYYSNYEIFSIFKSNKRLLLFLIEDKIMVMDDHIVRKITTEKFIWAKYPQYFSPEILPFITENWIQNYLINNPYSLDLIDEIKQEIPEDFDEKRKIGENDDYICELIRKDSIEDFVIFVNRTLHPLNSMITPSIYETNNYLLKKQSSTSLIEYAAFYGSIQIFNYLRLNNVTLRQSLWLYTIHGKNAELIHLLEQDGIKPVDLTYKKCVKESLKCHCNDIVNYFKDNFLKDAESNSQNILDRSLKYYNFQFISNIDKSSFYSLCHYDYYTFVDILLKKKVININETQILK